MGPRVLLTHPGPPTGAGEWQAILKLRLFVDGRGREGRGRPWSLVNSGGPRSDVGDPRGLTVLQP